MNNPQILGTKEENLATVLLHFNAMNDELQDLLIPYAKQTIERQIWSFKALPKDASSVKNIKSIKDIMEEGDPLVFLYCLKSIMEKLDPQWTTSNNLNPEIIQKVITARNNQHRLNLFEGPTRTAKYLADIERLHKAIKAAPQKLSEEAFGGKTPNPASRPPKEQEQPRTPAKKPANRPPKANPQPRPPPQETIAQDSNEQGWIAILAVVGIVIFIWFFFLRDDVSDPNPGQHETAQKEAAAVLPTTTAERTSAPAVSPTSETVPITQAMPTYLPQTVANAGAGTVPNANQTPPLELQIHTYRQMDFSIMYPTDWNPRDDLLTFTAPDGQGRLEIRAPYFDPDWSLQEFINQVKEDESLTPGMGLKWNQYLEENAMTGNIGEIEFIEIDFAGQITPGGCLQSGTTRWLPSRYLPDLTARGFSISMSVCEENLEEYEETIRQVLNSFHESNHDYEIQRELQRRAAEDTTEESPDPDEEP